MSEFRNDPLPAPKYVDLASDFQGAALVQKHFRLKYPNFPNLVILTPKNIQALNEPENQDIARRLQIDLTDSESPIKDLTWVSNANAGQSTYFNGTAYLAEAKEGSAQHQVIAASEALMDQYNNSIAINRFRWMSGAQNTSDGLETTVALSTFIAGMSDWILTEVWAREEGKEGSLYSLHKQVLDFQRQELMQRYNENNYPYKEALENTLNEPSRLGHEFVTEVMDVLTYKSAPLPTKALRLLIENPPMKSGYLTSGVWYARQIASAVTSQPGP